MPISALPTPPSRSDPANFATRSDAFLGQLPTFVTEANALATAVNADQVTASAAATTATTQAGTATTNAATATTQAGIATTQAGIATTQAGTATTQASIATTQASNALISANAAAASAAVVNLTAPGPIGGTTPGTGAFTTLKATTGASVGGATPGTGGVAFPATAVAVADANTLDDYEEGTFTPTVIGSSTSGAGTYTAGWQNGTYTKIGRQVHVRMAIIWTAHTGTGNLLVSALPFTSLNETNGRSAVAVYSSDISMTAGNTLQAYLSPNSSTISFTQVPTGGGAATVVPIDTAGTLILDCTYFI